MKFWSQMPIKENPSMEDVLMLGDTLDVNNPKTITLQQMMDIAGEKVSSVEVVDELPAEGRENKLYIKKISQDDTYVYESYIWDDNAYHQMSNGGGGADEKTIRQIEHRGIDIMNQARDSINNERVVGDVFATIQTINNVKHVVYELHGYDDKQDIIKLNMDEIVDMYESGHLNEPTIDEGILKGTRGINITATCRYIYDPTFPNPQVEIPITDEMWDYPIAFKGTFVNTHSYSDEYVDTPKTSIVTVYKSREGYKGNYSNPLTLRECYGHTIRLRVWFKFLPKGKYTTSIPKYTLQGYISPEPEIRKLIGSLPERIQVLDSRSESNDNSIVVFDESGNPVIRIDGEEDRTGDNVTINYPCDDEINEYNQKAMQIKSDGATICKPGDQGSIALSIGVDKCHFGLNNQTCFESNEAKSRILENDDDTSTFSVYGGHTYIVKSAIDKHLDYIIYNGQNFYENQRFYVASDGYAYKSDHAQGSWSDIRLYQLEGYNEVKIKDADNHSEMGIKDGEILIKAYDNPLLKTDRNHNQLTLRNPFTDGDIIKTYEEENPSITFYSGFNGLDGQLLRWENSHDGNENTVKLYGGDQNSIIESVCDLDNDYKKVIRINKHHEGVDENTIVIRDADPNDEWDTALNHKEGIHFIAKRLTFRSTQDDTGTKTLLAVGEETIDMGENDNITITPWNEYRYTINNLNYDNQVLTINGLNNGDFTIEFSIGNNIPNITFSNDIKFMSPPDFNSNQHWIIAIHNNYAVYAKYDL